MKKIKIIILSAWVIISSTPLLAQQEAQFTQYLDNMQYFNPAYVGSRNAMNFNLLHRQQWAGFSGAPMTTSFAFNTPLSYESVGVGLSVLNDKIGPSNSTWVNADVSYSLRFKKNRSKLSFGIKGGINIINGDLVNLVKHEENDDALAGNYRNGIQPNIGGGIYYSSDQWFIGAAVPRIFTGIRGENFTEVEYNDTRHYYFMAGGYIKANRMLKIRPSALFKFTENAPFALDFSVAAIFYDKVWLGGNYRLKQSAGVIFQYQFTNQFKMGYAFEMSTNKMRQYNAGTHEIMLSYDLKFKNRSLTSPRYF